MNVTSDDTAEPTNGKRVPPFCLIPNWFVDHPDTGPDDWSMYVAVRREFSYTFTERTEGYDLNQGALAEKMDLRRETVNRRLGRLERIHKEHPLDEPCPDDGSCTQALVKRRNIRRGRNAWATYFLDTTKAQIAPMCAETHNVSPGRTRSKPKPVDSPAPDGGPGTSAPETGSALCAETHSRCDVEITAAVTSESPRKKNKVLRAKTQEQRTTGHIAAPCDDGAGPDGLLDETCSALHRHMTELGLAAGVSQDVIDKSPGWNPRHWIGWPLVAEAPERIRVVMEFAFRVSDYWPGPLGARGVEGLRRNWEKVEAAYDFEHGEIDSREWAEKMGVYEP